MSRPNVLLLLTDQHRLSALGCYGGELCQTPNLDRLASEGVRFEKVYTTCPVCSPARASIISGQYPHRHGVTANVGAQSCNIWNIPDHSRMLPRVFERLGYQRGYTGKWHLCPAPACTEWFNEPVAHHVPSTLGFEGQDFPFHGSGSDEAHEAWLKEKGLTCRPVEGSVSPGGEWPHYQVTEGPVEASKDHFLADHTIGLIDRYRSAGDPFFIWHNHWGPHEQYAPMEAFYEPYRDLEIPPWPNFRVPEGLLTEQQDPKLHPRRHEIGWEYWQEGIRHYYAFATQIDHELGRIVRHLEETGTLENTLIVFAADHGETLGAHGGMWDKGYSHFEEIQRIPMIVRYPESLRPDGCPRGSVRNELISLADIYPTCLDWGGADLEPLAPHGRSIHRLLTGEDAEWRGEVFVEFYGMYAPTCMITCRAGDWKYGFNVNNRDELYNLAEDPHELKNRIDDPALNSVRRDLRGRIRNHLPAGMNPLIPDSC